MKKRTIFLLALAIALSCAFVTDAPSRFPSAVPKKRVVTPPPAPLPDQPAAVGDTGSAPLRIRRAKPLVPKPSDSVMVPFENTIVTCTPKRVPVESLTLNTEHSEHVPFRLHGSPFPVGAPRRAETGNSARWERSAVIFAGLGGAGYAVHRTYTKELWWQDRGPFHFAYDPGYAQNIDKLGHATAWYFVGTTMWMLYRWSGYSDMESRWLGLGTAALLHLETEGHEGFSRYFGFDPVDYLAGISGSALLAAVHAPGTVAEGLPRPEILGLSRCARRMVRGRGVQPVAVRERAGKTPGLALAGFPVHLARRFRVPVPPRFPEAPAPRDPGPPRPPVRLVRVAELTTRSRSNAAFLFQSGETSLHLYHEETVLADFQYLTAP